MQLRKNFKQWTYLMIAAKWRSTKVTKALINWIILWWTTNHSLIDLHLTSDLVQTSNFTQYMLAIKLQVHNRTSKRTVLKLSPWSKFHCISLSTLITSTNKAEEGFLWNEVAFQSWVKQAKVQCPKFLSGQNLQQCSKHNQRTNFSLSKISNSALWKVRPTYKSAFCTMTLFSRAELWRTSKMQCLKFSVIEISNSVLELSQPTQKKSYHTMKLFSISRFLQARPTSKKFLYTIKLLSRAFSNRSVPPPCAKFPTATRQARLTLKKSWRCFQKLSIVAPLTTLFFKRFDWSCILEIAACFLYNSL